MKIMEAKLHDTFSTFQNEAPVKSRFSTEVSTEDKLEEDVEVFSDDKTCEVF